MTKRMNLTFVCVLVIAFCVMFAAFFTVNAKPQEANAEPSYEVVKDFKTIDIDFDDPTPKQWNIKDMLGVDKTMASGYITYGGGEDASVVSFYNVSIFQIEDPLAFDESDERIALINIHASRDVDVRIKRENVIVNFGTAIKIDAPSQIVKVVAEPTEVYGESVLRIQNKPCYDGSVLPSISFNGLSLDVGRAKTDKFAYDSYILSLFISGVGGIEGVSDSYLTFAGETNAFFDVKPSKKYYTPEDPDNLIVIDEEEDNTEYPAIKGFKSAYFTESAMDWITINTGLRYDADRKVTTVNGVVSGYLTFGNFIAVTSYEDLEYALKLKKEDQKNKNAYDNIYLNGAIEKYTHLDSYIFGDDGKGALLQVNGNKRLFVYNRLCVTGMSEDSEEIALFRVNGKLDILGRYEDSYIQYSSVKTSYDNQTPVIYVDNGSLTVSNVTLASKTDIDGVNNEYDGSVLELSNNAKAVVYSGHLKGSTVETHGYYFGVVKLYNPEINTFALVDGCIESFENGIFTSTGYSSKMKFFGGTLLPHGGPILMSKSANGVDYADDAFSDYNDYRFVPNEKTFLYVYGGSSKYFVNGVIKRYDGLYSLDQIADLRTAEAVYFGDYFHAPYVKTDLPEQIIVDGEKSYTFTVELFNPNAKYESYLVVQDYMSRISLWSDYLASDIFGSAPYQSLIFDDSRADEGIYSVTILPSLQRNGALKLSMSFANRDYPMVGASTSQASVEVFVSTIPATITLSGPKSALNPESNDGKGCLIDYGADNSSSRVVARVSSSTAKYVYAQWKNVTDVNNPVSMTARIRLELPLVDEESGRRYSDFSFLPVANDDLLTTQKYSLYVWTPAVYDDSVQKETISDVVTYTVQVAAPSIISEPPAVVYANDGDKVTIDFEVGTNGGQLPTEYLAYKWYYYPSYEYIVTIGDAANVTFNSMSYQVMANDFNTGLYYKKTKTAYMVFDLTDYLDDHSSYRVTFDIASSFPKGTITAKIIRGLDESDSYTVESGVETFKAIKGTHTYEGRFALNKVPYGSTYKQADWCKLVVDFSDTPHVVDSYYQIKNFFLQKGVAYDEATGETTWENVVDLNPYYFAMTSDGLSSNHQGVYELLGASKNLDMNVYEVNDGNYVYCKVYNKQFPDYYVYTRPVQLRVNPNAIEPVVSDKSVSVGYVQNNDDTHEFWITTENPTHLNGEDAVSFVWSYYYYDLSGVKHTLTAGELNDLGAFSVSETFEPSTYKGKTTLTLKNKLGENGAKSFYNSILYVVATAISTDDASLTDSTEFGLYVIYEHEEDSAKIANVSVCSDVGDSEKVYKPVTLPSDGVYNFVNKNDESIKDIIYLNLNGGVQFKATLDKYYDQINSNEIVYYDYEWLVKTAYGWVSLDYAGLDEFCWNMDASGNLNLEWVYDDGNAYTSKRNFVVACRVSNTVTSEQWMTDCYQISCVDLDDWAIPALAYKADEYADEGTIYVSPVTVDGDGNICYSVTLYSGSFAIWGTLFYAEDDKTDDNYLKVLAYTKGTKTVPDVQMSYDARIYLEGPEYIENFFGYGEDGEYEVARFNYKNPADASKAKTDNALYCRLDVKIPYSVLEAYQKETLEKSSGISNSYCERIRSYREYIAENGFTTYDEYIAEFGYDDFTEADKEDLQKLWFDYYVLFATCDLSLNKGATVAQLKSERLFTYIWEYVEELQPKVDYDEVVDYYGDALYKAFTVKENGEDYINGTYPDYNATYAWFVAVYNEDDDQYDLMAIPDKYGEPLTDPYLTVDISELYSKTYVLKLTLSTMDPDKSVDVAEKVFYVPFNVDVIPEVPAPVISSIGNSVFGYKVPNCYLTVDAEVDDSIHYYFDFEKMRKVEDEYVVETHLFSEAYNTHAKCLISTEELGEWYWRVSVYPYVVYNVGDVEKIYYGKPVVSEIQTCEIVERSIDYVVIGGISQAVVGETPTVDGAYAKSVYDYDEYVGYTIDSIYWDGDPAIFEYDGQYKLVVTVKLMDNAVWADEVEGEFDALNDSFVTCNVQKVSDKYVLSYTYSAGESIVLYEIEVPAVTAEVGSLIKKVEPDRSGDYEVTTSWNVGYGSFEYGVEYVLTYEFKAVLGYIFDEDIVVKCGDETLETVLKDGVLTAKKTYKFLPEVVFDSNGGSGEMPSVTVYGEYELPSVGFTAPAKKTFFKWALNSLDGDQYAVGEKINIDNPVTLYALWQDVYEISFNANGGSGEMASVNSTGGEYKLTGCDFVAPEGKYFVAWLIGKDRKNVGETITVDSDVTLTAVWEDLPDDAFTVTFSSNSGSGSMAEVKAIGNYNLPLCAFTAPDGKRFKAWSVGGIELGAGATINVAASITVTAIWEDIPAGAFEVSFDSNGGSGEMASVQASGNFNLPLCAFTAPEGKRFKAWSISGVEKSVGSAIDVVADVTIVAVWEDIPAVEYTLIFVSNGGSGEMPSVKAVDDYVLPECAFTAPDGKTFKAWSIYSLELEAGAVVNVDKDGVVTALWKDIPVELPVAEYEKVKDEPATYGSDIDNNKSYDVTDLFETAKDGDGEVELKIGDATIVFDKDAVKEIGKDNADILVNVISADLEAAGIANAKLIVEITLNGNFTDGFATVTLPFDVVIPDNKVAKVYYVDANGAKTDMNATFADGKVVFKTNHFSTYAVLFEDKPIIDSEPEKKGLSGGAIAGIVIGAVVVALGIAFAVFFLLKKKKSATSETVKTEGRVEESVVEEPSVEAEKGEDEKEETIVEAEKREDEESDEKKEETTVESDESNV